MANTSGKGWSAQLTRTIVLRDGTTLATLADVRTFILNEPVHIQERGSWQHAAELMILAAERGGSVEARPFKSKMLCFSKPDTRGHDQSQDHRGERSD
jgi:hypothetical protein